MGRTVPSFRIAAEIERTEWKQFRSYLDKKDRKIFDQMYDCVKLYNTACMTACRPVIIHSVLMSIIFEDYKQLHQLESEIDRKEREQVTSLNDWITEVDLRFGKYQPVVCTDIARARAMRYFAFEFTMAKYQELLYILIR